MPKINDGNLILRLLTKLNNKNVYYQWYKEGHPIFEGMNAVRLF